MRKEVCIRRMVSEEFYLIAIRLQSKIHSSNSPFLPIGPSSSRYTKRQS
ncbi:hypothetical protein [Jeotgalibacillus campisalis]|nr:hypothetical protein [Jeotgalibacillus campisalis]